MKSNVAEFSTEVVVETVTPATCLTNRLNQVPPLLTFSSEENPTENPSESSRRLSQVQWNLPATVTLDRALKNMATKVTNSNNYTWGNSLRSDTHARAEYQAQSPCQFLDNNPRFTDKWPQAPRQWLIRGLPFLIRVYLVSFPMKGDWSPQRFRHDLVLLR